MLCARVASREIVLDTLKAVGGGASVNWFLYDNGLCHERVKLKWRFNLSKHP